MAIQIEESSRASYPVIRHQRIGEQCQLSIIRFEQRDRLRTDPETRQMVKIPNGFDRNNNPKYKQELVIHGLVMPGGNMHAGLGGTVAVPAVGDRVRLILKAKGFGDWIEARKVHRGGKFCVGDVLSLSTTHAQAYDQAGAPKGQMIKSQAEADALPRGVSVGFYGPISLAEGSDLAWVQKAEAAYHADQNQQHQPTEIGGGAADEEEVW